MNNIAIYTLTSELHDTQAVSAATQEFLGSLNISYDFRDNDYSDYGSHPLDIIYVRTGGAESTFLRLLPVLLKKTAGTTFYLLTSGKSNSLAASLEILSYLRQQGISGEVIHGEAAHISQRINTLLCVNEALQKLKDCKLGVVGKPSDWLIASDADDFRRLSTSAMALIADSSADAETIQAATAAGKPVVLLNDWRFKDHPANLEHIRTDDGEIATSLPC